MNPVFVVGFPRTGTTLLAAMLASHPSFSCGPETHFFMRTTPKQRRRAIDGRWPDSAVRLLSQLTLEGESILELFGQDPESLRKALAVRPRREATLLEALTEPYAARLGKCRWVEKTPAHILRLSEIVNAFPDATIVRIVRDPRASAHSMTNVPFGSKNYLANCVHLMNWHASSRAFFRLPGRHFTLRHEDLITDPEGELTRLCGFLGEDYDRSMLNYEDSARLIQTKAETWKICATRPLSTEVVDRWRREVALDDQKAAALFLKPALDEFGYSGGIEAARSLPVYALTERVANERLDLMIAATRANVRVRLLPEPPMNIRPLFASFAIDLRTRPYGRNHISFLLLILLALARALARGERPGYLTPIVSRDSGVSKLVRLMVTALGRAEAVHQALDRATPIAAKEGDPTFGAAGRTALKQR